MTFEEYLLKMSEKIENKIDIQTQKNFAKMIVDVYLGKYNSWEDYENECRRQHMKTLAEREKDLIHITEDLCTIEIPFLQEIYLLKEVFDYVKKMGEKK